MSIEKLLSDAKPLTRVERNTRSLVIPNMTARQVAQLDEWLDHGECYDPEVVARVAVWLYSAVPQNKYPNTTTIGMAEAISLALGASVKSGEFAAAAVLAGFPFRFNSGGELLFAMSIHAVDELRHGCLRCKRKG